METFPYLIEVRDKEGVIKKNITSFCTNIKWEWNRLGGCGSASMKIHKPYREIEFMPMDDIQISIKEDGVIKLCYRGYISNITPSLTSDQSVSVEMRGYFDFLKKLVVQQNGDIKTYEGGLISTTVEDIIDTFVTPYTSITKGTIDASDFQCDTIQFLTTVEDALNTLAQLSGSAEYGVDEDLVFFWKNESEDVRTRFFVGNNVEMVERRVNYSNLVNRVYLIGGEVNGVRFKRTLENTDSQDNYNLVEKVVNNGSITTQTVADQYIGYLLRENADPVYSTKIKVANTKVRLEDTIPIGAISVYDVNYDRNVDAPGGVIIGEAVDGGDNIVIGLNDLSNDPTVKFLTHATGIDEQTTGVIAETGQPMTFNNGVKIDTDSGSMKFGTSGLNFPSVNSHIAIQDSSDWSIINEDFTIDCWQSLSTTPAFQDYHFICGQFVGVVGNYHWLFYTTPEKRMRFYGSYAGIVRWCYSTPLNTLVNYTTPNWHHYALVKHGTNIYMFFDGVKQTLGSSIDQNIGSYLMPDLDSPLYLGYYVNTDGTYYYRGWKDEFRLIKGRAVWTDSFTPPLSEYSYTLSGSGAVVGDLFTDQVNRIQYEFSNTDERFNITIQFGDTNLQTSAMMKRLDLAFASKENY